MGLTQAKEPDYNQLIMRLIPDGAYIMCAKHGCGARMDLSREMCPRCSGVKCYIEFRWKPPGAKNKQRYFYRRDDQGEQFRCFTAVAKLTELTKEMKSTTFSAEKFTDGAITERLFENQYATFGEEMKKKYTDGKWSEGHFLNLGGYGKHYYTWFDGKDVLSIDLQMLKQFKTFVEGTRKKSKTLGNILGMLHKFLQWMFEKGVLPAVPAFPEIEGGDEDLRTALRRSEQLAGLDKIRNAKPSKYDSKMGAEGHQVIADMLELMMHTGIRHSEIVAVLAGHVDLDQRAIWVQRTRDGYKRYRERTKNTEKLPVPLNDTALAIVRKYTEGKLRNACLFVNPRTGKPFSKWSIWSTWKRLSGTEVCSYEATRHSFCSQVRSKVPAPIGQRLMRHKTATQTDRYYHEWTDNLVDAVKTIDGTPEKKPADVIEIASKQNPKK